MRKLVCGFAVSLDGYIEGPAGEIDWILVDAEMDFSAQMKRYDSFFYGRKTYESILKMGPFRAGHAAHYVFSRTLQSVAEGCQLIRGDIVEAVRRIKNERGRDIALFGGAALLASLLDAGLVDEISMAIIPVLLGSGKPMVHRLRERVKLKLQETHAYSNGTVQLTYTVAHET